MTLADDALASYERLARNSVCALPEEARDYQAWLEERQSIVESERGFLNDQEDLIRLGNKSCHNDDGDVTNNPTRQPSRNLLERENMIEPLIITAVVLIGCFAIPTLMGRIAFFVSTLLVGVIATKYHLKPG